MEIQYLNEHLLPGRLAHFFLILSFVSSLLASVSYFFSVNEKDAVRSNSWKNMGRIAFSMHGAGIFWVIGTMFYMMLSQYYEYHYVWSHVSEDLDFSYIFAAFWEGQEGSFLLWMFWHIVLGLVIMIRRSEWEAPVLSVLSLIQVFIGTMILGLHFYFGDDFFKIGSNPLLLLRDVQEAPIFQNPDYVSLIKGNGLNPLLQNYWMTIHPPTLFLGFASVAIPFAYAIAGLWTKKYTEWIPAALPWALFSGMVLGTGILMGGAWAYEALSFGGYWAWDPVENMSLVPWLVLVAGIHAAVVAKSTGYSVKSTYLFFVISFLLILYSTFLTRSGILGDTSVHAFTEMGLEWQLIVFIFCFSLIGLVLFIRRAKFIPEQEKEESIYSREFWMFIGALVLLFSSVLITHTTSIPVYSKIGAWFHELTGWGFLKNAEFWSPPENVVGHHNRYQIWIALFIAFLSGTSQFLWYRKEKLSGDNRRFFLKHILTSIFLAIGLALITGNITGISGAQYLAFLTAGYYAILANLDYIVSVLKGKIWIAGSAISHMGFGILIIGVLYSGGKKRIISNDFMSVNLIEGFEEEDVRSNILLNKDLPTKMQDYLVTYKGDSIKGLNRTFRVDFQQFDKDQNLIEEFELYPNVLYDKDLTKIAASNPSTKHYWTKDIFTHVSALPTHEVDPESARKAEDTLQYTPHTMKIGDTIYTSGHYIIFERFNRDPVHPEYKPRANDIVVSAILNVKLLDSAKTWTAEPVYLIRGNFGHSLDAEVAELGLKFRFVKIEPAEETVTIEIAESTPKPEYVVLQAIVFPLINLVWLGSILMLFGLGISMVKRYKEKIRKT